MGVVIHLDKAGSGQGWNGQVEFRADLPITLGNPLVGEIYLVEKKTTLFGITTYQSGLYIRDFNNGNLNDWRRLNVKVNFTDSEFAIVNAVDSTKKSKFDLSLISASTTRTYTLPDKDGIVAMLSDVVGGSTFYISDGTFLDPVRNANISQNNILNFISKASLPADDKTALKITANGIFGSLETDLNFRFNGSNAQNYSIYGNNNASFIFDNGAENISFAIGRGGSGQYLQYFDLNSLLKTDLFFTPPTQNNTLNFPDKSGTLAILNDINNRKNISSSQWVKSAIPPSALPNGNVANGFTFFDNVADKVANGTTSYDEYNIAYGIDLTLTGTSGTANINVAGVDYLATFNTSLAQTAQDWINTHKATLAALNVRVLYNGGSPLNANGNETIRFCASEANCNSVTITTLTGDLNGTRINPFTGVNAAAGDHVLIPYVGKPYENQRIHHTFRVNFEIATGSQQTLALSLRRFADDTIIASEIQIFRTPDEEGQQYFFETYTSGVNDPFTTGGFYFALRNDSGVSIDIQGDVGILLQQTFQSPLDFS